MMFKPSGYPRGKFVRLVIIFTVFLCLIAFVLPLLVGS